MIPVVVNGATGKMGQAIVKAIAKAEDMTLMGAIARNPALQGQDIGEVIGCGAVGSADHQRFASYFGNGGTGRTGSSGRCHPS